jgi:hydrogenase maturation protein HypF
MRTVRYRIHVNGIVQGVGFRPFVYRLARECGLGGFVLNASDGVLIEIEGTGSSIDRFQRKLSDEAPPLATIAKLEIGQIEPGGSGEFVIRSSQQDSEISTLISPDVAVCEACLEELFDPADRRYFYPFINCTDCGPRYTIVRRIPYDRPNTSMREFSLCEDCAREYHNPEDRRFHAQPNACGACGPQLALADAEGLRVPCDDPLTRSVALLEEGRIIAVRGLGGFHLAVDAFNEGAVRELRRRKGRAEKPFALMAPDVDTIREFCWVDAREEAVLRSHLRPIVLLRTRPGCEISPAVAPGNLFLGFMLPYTPLHYLLLRGRFRALVMTSANYIEEPIVIGNSEARDRLGSICDYLLLHNREILQRCDDSVLRLTGESVRLIRRSRGFVPSPIFLGTPTRESILACGGELKNTIAYSRGETVFLSQHIGDLDNPAGLTFFEECIDHLGDILEIEPTCVAHDLHPEYLSTKWAQGKTQLTRIGVQHHHAHLASVLAENQAVGPAVGIILDGTGYGMDGTIWGGEVLVGDAGDFQRFAWLQPFRLPGGEAAVREPWRTAVSALHEGYKDQIEYLDLPFLYDLQSSSLETILAMLDKGVNSPLTSSCGRLFDAVSALLNIRTKVSFEAQAAIELEMAVDESINGFYSSVIPQEGREGPIAVKPLIHAIVEDIQKGVETGVVAARFHWSLAEMFVAVANSAREIHGVKRAALSGGVFQNLRFFTYLEKRLREERFEVLTHSRVPCNDGGLSLGQIAVASAVLSA